MKKAISAVCIICLLISAFGSVGVFAATEKVYLEQNFNSISEGTTITTANSGIPKIVPGNVGSTPKTNFRAYKEDTNTVMKISLNAASGVTSASSRFDVPFDVSKMKDLTVEFKYKAEGGAALNLLVPYASSTPTLISTKNTDWKAYKICMDFETLKCKYYIDGADCGELPISVADILHTADFYLRFSVSVTSAKTHYFDDIKIYSSGEEYSKERAEQYQRELVAGIVDKAPFIAPEGKKVLIWKFDDFGDSTFERYTEVANEIMERGMHAGFGAIGNRCTSFTDEQWKTIKKWSENGIEIWYHGYDHKCDYKGDDSSQYTADFQNMSYEDMKENVAKGIAIFAAHGIELKSIGAPNNLNDDVYLEMLNNEYPEQITSLLYAKDNSNVFEKYNLNQRINLEASVGSADCATFIKSYNSKKETTPVMVAQGHAGSWRGNNTYSEFIDALDFLKDEQIVTMTPTEYVNYIEGEYFKGKSEFTGISYDSAEFEYDGAEHHATLTGIGNLPKTATVYYKAMQKNAGDYKTRVIIKADGYKGVRLVAPLKIKKRPITITADAASKKMGESDKAFTYKITSGSLIEGDALSGALSREAGETAGKYAITIGTLTAGDNYDITFVPEYLTISSSSPSSYIIGDANMDKSVNNRDATRILQYKSGWAVEINLDAANVNGDDVVNNRDATRILQYKAGWDVVLIDKNAKVASIEGDTF